MARGQTFTVKYLAAEAIALRCACRVRRFTRADLIARVGPDAPLHLIGLRRELWCEDCAEAPFSGWLVTPVTRGAGRDASASRRCEASSDTAGRSGAGG